MSFPTDRCEVCGRSARPTAPGIEVREMVERAYREGWEDGWLSATAVPQIDFTNERVSGDWQFSDANAVIERLAGIEGE